MKGPPPPPPLPQPGTWPQGMDPYALQLTPPEWRLTGQTRYAPSWLGHVLLMVEEHRKVFRPIVTGYTPANWRTETRWRRARFRDFTILERINQK